MRRLVYITLKAEYKSAWEEALIKHLQESARLKIEAMGALRAPELMEETYLPDLIQAILGNWKLFSAFFNSRDDFREHAKVLIELSRPIADHRKYELCADDAKWMLFVV